VGPAPAAYEIHCWTIKLHHSLSGLMCILMPLMVGCSVKWLRCQMGTHLQVPGPRISWLDEDNTSL